MAVSHILQKAGQSVDAPVANVVAVVRVRRAWIAQAYYQPLVCRHAAILAYRFRLRRGGGLLVTVVSAGGSALCAAWNAL